MCSVVAYMCGGVEYNIIVCCDTVFTICRDDIGWCNAYSNHRPIKELVE